MESWPTANVYWKNLNPTAKVKLLTTGGGGYYVAETEHGPAVVDWCSRTAQEAQRFLDRRAAETARDKWQEHYDTCDDPDFCAHDAPSLDAVEALENRLLSVYDGQRRFSHDVRVVGCSSCGAEPETDKPAPCRAMTGNRPGRAVSYHHKARTLAWYEAGKPRSRFFQ